MLIENCQQVVELVTAYLEGDLSPEDTRQVEGHLSGCPGCDAYLAQMRPPSARSAGSMRPGFPTTSGPACSPPSPRPPRTATAKADRRN